MISFKINHKAINRISNHWGWRGGGGGGKGHLPNMHPHINFDHRRTRRGGGGGLQPPI